MLVPYLKASTECNDIPKESCSKSKTNPRKVKKPTIKTWCYEYNTTTTTPETPTEPPTEPPTTTCDPCLLSLIGKTCE